MYSSGGNHHLNRSSNKIEGVDFKLHIKPRQPGISLDEFIRTTPPYSIGLDGYVSHPVYEDFDAPRANYDHHVGCDRLSTRATCAQIWMAIRQGLFDVFRDQNGPRVEAWINDCDEDECASLLLLREPHLVMRDTRRRLGQLMDIFDKLDTTAGLYTIPLDSRLLQSILWITDPYRETRFAGKLFNAGVTEYNDIIDQVGKRIKRYINGTHRKLKPDTRFKRIGGGSNWSMIKEVGKQGRMGAIADGQKAIVAARELPNGNHAYVFTRVSKYIRHFNLPAFTKMLNKIDSDGDDQWGGGDLVMGSPRSSGSRLEPRTLEFLTNTMMTIGPDNIRELEEIVANDQVRSLSQKRLQISL